MRRSIVWLSIITLLVCATTGCGSEPFPKQPLKPVKGFSLGGARFTPFKHRPSAQELYNATLKLYDSFKSVAMSMQFVTGKVSPQALETVGQLRIERVRSSGTDESRAIEPDKRLTVTQIKGGVKMVDVTNGGKSFAVWGTTRVYPLSVTAKGHSAASGLAGLSPGPLYAMASPRLLPDEVVNGTPTYVLELRRTRAGSHVAVMRLYLGKADLLLRRREVIFENLPSAKAKEEVLDGVITTVCGFVGNPKLSASIFPTKLPKDAKPAKGVEQESP